MTSSIESKVSEIASGLRKVGDASGLVQVAAQNPGRLSELSRRAVALGAGLITAFEFVEDFTVRELEAAEAFISSRFHPVGMAA